MPQIPSFRQPTRSDIPELPDWAMKMLYTINSQIDLLTKAAQNKLSHKDNLNEDERDLKLRHGVEAIVTVKKIRGKPSGLEVIYTNPPLLHKVVWAVVDDHHVRLTVYFSTVPSFSGAAGTVPTGKVDTRIRVSGN